MNNFQKELPKDENNSIYKSEVKSMILRINDLVNQKDYSKAYSFAEKCRTRLNTKRFFSNKDRNFLRKTILNAVEKELSQEIRKKYVKALNFYRHNYSIIEQNDSPYANNPRLYIRSKAKEALREEYRKSRFGAYMHVVIDDIINKYEDEMNLENKKQEKNQNKMKLLSLSEKDDDLDR